MWAVELLDAAEMVGLCGFFPREESELELGYVIRADRWRHGLGGEVVSAVLGAARGARRRVFAARAGTPGRVDRGRVPG